jgi:hypothetical protein
VEGVVGVGLGKMRKWAKNVEDVIKHVVELKGPWTTHARNVISTYVVKQNIEIWGKVIRIFNICPLSMLISLPLSRLHVLFPYVQFVAAVLFPNGAGWRGKWWPARRRWRHS